MANDGIANGFSEDRQQCANRSDALVKLRQLSRMERTANAIEEAEANGTAETTLENLRRERWKRNYIAIVGVSHEERHELRTDVERIAETGDSPVFIAIQSARGRFLKGLEERDDVGWTSSDLRVSG